MPTLSIALLQALKDHGAREIFGIPGDFANPRFLDAIDRIAAAAAAAGKCAGILARSVEEALGYAEREYRFVGVGSDAALLGAQLKQVSAGMRAGRAAG